MQESQLKVQILSRQQAQLLLFRETKIQSLAPNSCPLTVVSQPQWQPFSKSDTKTARFSKSETKNGTPKSRVDDCAAKL